MTYLLRFGWRALCHPRIALVGFREGQGDLGMTFDNDPIRIAPLLTTSGGTAPRASTRPHPTAACQPPVPPRRVKQRGVLSIRPDHRRRHPERDPAREARQRVPAAAAASSRARTA